MTVDDALLFIISTFLIVQKRPVPLLLSGVTDLNETFQLIFTKNEIVVGKPPSGIEYQTKDLTLPHWRLETLQQIKRTAVSALRFHFEKAVSTHFSNIYTTCLGRSAHSRQLNAKCMLYGVHCSTKMLWYYNIFLVFLFFFFLRL